MKIVRNYKFIERRRRIGLSLSFIGMGVLIGGMILTFAGGEDRTMITLSFISLPLGWLLSQVGLYFSNRYVRSPRPDEQLDEGLRKVAKGAVMYHFVLPVHHVILSRSGIITVVPKYQGGNITVDDYKWKQTGIGFFRRIFGQENIGNPSVEAEYNLKQIAKFISHNVPELAETELPIGAVIVFTTKDSGELDLRRSTIPAMHYTKLKGFWRQRSADERLDEETYQLLRDAFDREATKAIGGEIEYE